MTNKYKYFVANWKMFGDIRTINSINKVIRLSKSKIFSKSKIVYCPPYTLLSRFIEKLKNTKIEVGAQNCHPSIDSGPYTGFVNSKMLKNLKCKYVIIGHSENRMNGENDSLINEKIKSAVKNKLTVFFCIGENIKEKRQKKTKRILSSQLAKGLKNIRNIKNVIVAYEPVWSIGTGIIPTNDELLKNILFIKNFIKKKFRHKNLKVLYGGSVNSKNIKNLREINQIDGFLIGGASQKVNKFIDIIKKTYN